MTIRQIECFLSLCSTKCFTDTAHALFMTQPAVSQQILALEKDISCTLFERKKGGVELTTAGQAFYEEAASILSHVNSVYHKVRQSKNSGQVIRTLCYLPPIRILPTLVSEFSRLHPEVFLAISRADTLEKNSRHVFLQHDISIGFGNPEQDNNGLTFYPLYSGGLICCLHKDHSLAHKSIIRMEDLHGENIYTINEHPQNEMFFKLNQYLSGTQGSHFFPRLMGIYDASAMAASGQCVCILPDIFVPVTNDCISIPVDLPFYFHLGLYVSAQPPQDVMDFCEMALRLCREDELPPVIF